MQLSPERNDGRLVLDGKGGVLPLRLESLGQAARLLGGRPQLRLLGAQLTDPARDPGPLRHQRRLAGEIRLALQAAQPLLVTGEGGHPVLGGLDLGLEPARLAGGDPQGAGAAPLRAHSLQGVAQALQRVGGGAALRPGIDQPLEGLAEASGLLRRRLGRREVEALLAQPGCGAEDRLVDPEVEAARAHRPADPELLGDVAPAQLLDLGLHPVAVEGLGHAQTAPSVQPVGEGHAEAAWRPGEPAGPVAALPRPARPPRLQAVEGGPDGAVQGRLAGLVRTEDDGDPLPEVEAPLAQRGRNR